MPVDFPLWQTVYHVFRLWSRDKTWAALNAGFITCLRHGQQRQEQPTAYILDSQSVKSDGDAGDGGDDAGKPIKRRKCHALVDSLGLLLGVIVTPASCTERDGAQPLLDRVAGWYTKLRKIWVDGS